MGMFDSFLGKGGGGYTEAQRTGLARSAEIKKRRKKEERTFEREKMKFTAERVAEEAEKERGHKELLTAMEGVEQRKTEGMKPQPVSQRKLQQLRGEQASALSAQQAEQTATQKSMEARRRLSEIEAKGPTDWKETETFAGDKFFYSPSTGRSKYPQSPGKVAREGLEGNQKEYTFAQFTGLDPDKQKKYMAHMYSEDKEKYLDFARQWGLLVAPKEESPKEESPEEEPAGVSGADIRRSLGGTYTNF